MVSFGDLVEQRLEPADLVGFGVLKDAKEIRGVARNTRLLLRLARRVLQPAIPDITVPSPQAAGLKMQLVAHASPSVADR